jgi:hypothetical protein
MNVFNNKQRALNFGKLSRINCNGLCAVTKQSMKRYDSIVCVLLGVVLVVVPQHVYCVYLIVGDRELSIAM